MGIQQIYLLLQKYIDKKNRNLYDCTKEIYWINRPIVYALFCRWSKLHGQHSIQTR